MTVIVQFFGIRPLNGKMTCSCVISYSTLSVISSYISLKFIERYSIETSIIQHTKNLNMNTSNGLYNLDNIFLHIFNKVNKQYKPGDKL